MKLYVNTEQINIVTETLSSLKNCLTTEFSTLEKIAYNLQGQSIPIDSIYRTIQNIHDIENEINLLVQKLRKIKNVYDDTEYGVLNDVRQLPDTPFSGNIAQQVTIYKAKSSSFSPQTSSSYIKFVSAVPVSNITLTMQQLLLRKKMKELPKVMNQILALYEEQREAWLIEKLRKWMCEYIHFGTGYVPFEVQVPTLDATDLFQDT